MHWASLKNLRPLPRGKSNPNWIDGRTIGDKFCHCGKKLSDYRSIQCLDCYREELSKKNKVFKRSKVITCEECGKEFRCNFSRIKDGRKFCGNGCAIKANSGEKSHLWKGGITKTNFLIRNSKRFQEWRMVIFKRDNFQCQECKSISKIEAHHIKPFAFYSDLRFEISNGITLCRKCHKKTDSFAKNKFAYL